MQIWNYDPTTGELTRAGFADPDPLTPGEWLVPAHATSLVPPEASGGFARVFIGGQWQLIPDHRGEVWWEAHGQPITITELGEVPGGLFEEEPPPPEPTLEEQIAVLEAAHSARIEQLRQDMGTALLFDGPGMDATLADLRARYASAWDEYILALEELVGG